MGVGLPPNAISRDGHQQAQFYWQTAGINNLGTRTSAGSGQAFDQFGGIGALPGAIASTATRKSRFTAIRPRRSSSAATSRQLYRRTTAHAGGTRRPIALAMRTTPTRRPPCRRNSRAPWARRRRASSPTFKPSRRPQPLSDYSTNYPTGSNNGSGLKSQFKQIARMIMGGAPTRTYYVRQGGYDTHGSQNADQPGSSGRVLRGGHRVQPTSRRITRARTSCHDDLGLRTPSVLELFGRNRPRHRDDALPHRRPSRRAGPTSIPGAQGVTSTGYPNLNKSALRQQRERLRQHRLPLPDIRGAAVARARTRRRSWVRPTSPPPEPTPT